MRTLTSLIAGLVFGIGLTIADMTNPAKVQNFLDVAGIWDPSLIFVMGGAALVALVGFRLVQMWPKPLFDAQFHIPSARVIDARLIGGSALFGVGWGVSGFCPGPAVAGMAWGKPGTFLFVVAMLAGMAIADWFVNPRAGPAPSPAE